MLIYMGLTGAVKTARLADNFLHRFVSNRGMQLNQKRNIQSVPRLLAEMIPTYLPFISTSLPLPFVLHPFMHYLSSFLGLIFDEYFGYRLLEEDSPNGPLEALNQVCLYKCKLAVLKIMVLICNEDFKSTKTQLPSKPHQ